MNTLAALSRHSLLWPETGVVGSVHRCSNTMDTVMGGLAWLSYSEDSIVMLWPGLPGDLGQGLARRDWTLLRRLGLATPVLIMVAMLDMGELDRD